ncbi:MAG: CehA/McbA family metallohydrolase [Deltaproteobacteria bacterium]|nr:CehA/McbA family metallohydrolase [Deltaproteobacteria bacterium]
MFDFEYVGNLHVHSRYSDGTRSIEEIAVAAEGAGLDFVYINDHECLAGDLHAEHEGRYGKVMVFMGHEIGRKDHHYLAFGLKEAVNGDGLPPQEVIDQVKAKGGLGFLAHPFEKGMPFLEKSRAYTWKDLSVTGFDGICIWNFSSRWKERVKTPFHGLLFLAFKSQLLKGPSQETLAFWDRLCLERRVSAIGGSDAHGGIFKWGPIRFTPLSYEFLLNTINVHLFLHNKVSKDFDSGKKAILDSMKEGRLFIAHDGLHPAKGFRFDFVSSDGFSLVMGEECPFQKGEIVIECPCSSEIRLIKNGRPERIWRGREAVYEVLEAGVYRVEVYLRHFLFGWRPWIFSNPIYLR